MTYCIGILLDQGVVLASDSRTNAGIDRVSTLMFTFEKPGERFFTLLTAGNLSLTQGVVSLIGEWLGNENPEQDLLAVSSMFGAPRVIGTALRQIHKIDGGYLQQHDVDFTATFILAGQLKGGQLRLFLVYDAGNFIEAMGETAYFQIGEVKYGKPILDRILRHDMSRIDAAKCALISFDSTMRSNVSVGPPIDLLIYRRNSLKSPFAVSLEDDDPYLQAIRERWGGTLHKAFHDIVHDPAGSSDRRAGVRTSVGARRIRARRSEWRRAWGARCGGSHACHAGRGDTRFRRVRILDDLRREIAHLLQLLHECLHLLARVLALQFHGLIEVFALGELHGQGEIGLGVVAGDLGDLAVQRVQTFPRRR